MLNCILSFVSDSLCWSKPNPFCLVYTALRLCTTSLLRNPLLSSLSHCNKQNRTTPVLLLSGDLFFFLPPVSLTAPFCCISILLQQPRRQAHAHAHFAEGAPYIMSESGGAPWESGRRAVCFSGGVSQRSCRESEQRRMYNAALQIALHHKAPVKPSVP